jgi:hypothetical protein
MNSIISGTIEEPEGGKDSSKMHTDGRINLELAVRIASQAKQEVMRAAQEEDFKPTESQSKQRSE